MSSWKEQKESEMGEQCNLFHVAGQEGEALI